MLVFYIEKKGTEYISRISLNPLMLPVPSLQLYVVYINNSKIYLT